MSVATGIWQCADVSVSEARKCVCLRAYFVVVVVVFASFFIRMFLYFTTTENGVAAVLTVKASGNTQYLVAVVVYRALEVKFS